MMGRLIPEYMADHDRNDLSLRSQPQEDADTIGPSAQRFGRTRINIRIGFDMTGGEGQNRAPRAKMGAHSAQERNPLDRIVGYEK